MKRSPREGYRIGAVSALLICIGICAFVNPTTVLAQESSRREAEIIKEIGKAGGRVMQISSADASREVSFYLAGKKIADANLKDINVVQNVIWLNLANTSVTDGGLKNIAGLKLQKLHLEKTGIGDSGLMHLKEMEDLTYLNLYATKVTDEGLKHLTGLKKLRKVYVWQSQVTENGMKSLEKQIPGLKVIGESKLPKATKEEQLASREKKLNQKEKQLNEKEASLKKREQELKKKAQAIEKLRKKKS